MAQRRASTKGRRTAHLAVDVADFVAKDANGEVPTEFRIFRFGVNHSEKGDFLFDAAAAESVMAEYRAHGKPMLLDFNHGTTLFAPTPEQAISAGEFTPEVRTDGLYAVGIKWTERAGKMLAAKEYRLFSPFFEHESATGRITRLINVALTNLPALDNIEPLVAASAAEGGTMDFEKLYTELKARFEALEAEKKTLMAKLAAHEEAAPATTAAVQLRSSVLTLTGKQTDAEALGALQALQASHQQLVTLKAEVETQKTARLTSEFNAMLESATNPDPKSHTHAAKITPAQKPYWQGVAADVGLEKATAQLRSFLDTAVKLTVGQVTPPSGAGPAMTQQQRDVARRLHITEKEWQESEAKRLAGGGS